MRQRLTMVRKSFLYVSFSALKPENALWSHIEEQVEHREVGQESMALLIHLIVGLRHEIGVGLWVLGTNGLAEIFWRVYG